MTIKVGDRLPSGVLMEFIETETPGCTVGPNQFNVDELAKGKRVVLFGVPGAFTPTCSAKHLPGYVQNYEALRKKGIDEVWCMSVNDAFVMGAWGREQATGGKVRMFADGSGAYTRALGLEFDLTGRGFGVRCQRFAMLIDNGVVKSIKLEEPGKFEVSNVETMLSEAGTLGIA